jgi:sulfur carrier protein ThiS
MRIYVNDRPVDLPAGMTVKHALIQCGLLREVGASKKAFDEWKNEMGLDGALSDGMKIYVK